jgi:hypothetical protein
MVDKHHTLHATTLSKACSGTVVVVGRYGLSAIYLVAVTHKSLEATHQKVSGLPTSIKILERLFRRGLIRLLEACIEGAYQFRLVSFQNMDDPSVDELWSGAAFNDRFKDDARKYLTKE